MTDERGELSSNLYYHAYISGTRSPATCFSFAQLGVDCVEAMKYICTTDGHCQIGAGILQRSVFSLLNWAH